MKTSACSILALTALLGMISCSSSNKETSAQKTSAENASNASDVIEVIARDFSFEVVDEIPSGWSTFRFNNSGHAEHFFLLNLLPDSISFEEYHEQVTKPFDVVFDSLKAGISKAEAGAMLGAMIPAWYFTSVKSMGGPGIVDAGMIAQVTVNLTPGTYVMECYIKEKGVFHTTLGMIRPITVTSEPSGMEPPTANIEMTLSNFTIETVGDVKAGTNTVAVHFKEHPEIGLGNDVHLIRMNDSTEIEEVVYWLDWMNIEGLQSPSPVDFLGGSQEMPVGHTAYFTVDVTPGNYAWIAESSAAKGMVKLFTVE